MDDLKKIIEKGREYPPAEALKIKRREEIWALAEEFAKRKGFKAGDDIVSFIEKLGGEVLHVSMDQFQETDDGSILVHPEKYLNKLFHVFVSNFTGALRNRFTLAHELGHFVLHSNEGQRQLKAARSGSDKAEVEANNFAAAFLMPSEEFKEVHSRTNHLLSTAAHFKVSEAAADVRQKQLFK